MPAMRRLLVGLVALLMAACTSSGLPPLAGIDRPVELPRFMGDWYVIAHIPIHFPPLFSEKGAHNGIESYALEPDGSIATTYTFRRGAFDGPPQRFTPRARVVNAPVNSEWKMKFFWYLPAGDFLILHVDEDYRHTIIGVPDRRYIWIMAREPVLPEAEYTGLVDLAAAMGYEAGRIQRVPQRWP